MWRREFGFYDKLTPSFVEPEGLTGKALVFGFDTDRRPCLYLFPNKQNTKIPEFQIQYTFWMLERSLDLMGPGVE